MKKRYTKEEAEELMKSLDVGCIIEYYPDIKKNEKMIGIITEISKACVCSKPSFFKYCKGKIGVNGGKISCRWYGIYETTITKIITSGNFLNEDDFKI